MKNFRLTNPPCEIHKPTLLFTTNDIGQHFVEVLCPKCGRRSRFFAFGHNIMMTREVAIRRALEDWRSK